jgi:uncharacterized protein (TIGR02757 family)
MGQASKSKSLTDVKKLLDTKAKEYNRSGFITDDPISIPHQFDTEQDIEIMSFIAATLAWGRRATIISKCQELVDRMGGKPFHFVTSHQEADLRALEGFCHRTFNEVDLLYFVDFLRRYYEKYESLETAFTQHLKSGDGDTGSMISGFHKLFFDHPNAPKRTTKHVATPERKSACKRINMFLRWMVRRDSNGVDFGIWRNIDPALLVCPLDIHVERVSKKLGLLDRKQSDWQAAVELTKNLRSFDPKDPVKYDFALFGLGLEGFAS